MTFILDATHSVELATFGGKATALAQLANTGLPIPPWFVISPEAFYQSLPQARRDAIAQNPGAASIPNLFTDLTPTTALLTELQQALDAIAPNDERLAVRSSAVDEDSASHSFAGQLESWLFVPKEQVLERIVDVWRSGFSERVIQYRLEAGLPALPTAPAVLVQRMINSEQAGVAFSVDPVSGRRDQAIVSAVHGLGNALVSGDADADSWHVDVQGQILERSIVSKQFAERLDPLATNYLRQEPLIGDDRVKPSLPDTKVQQVAQLARDASRYFGKPQDIEWAIEAGELYLLQSRPITSLQQLPDRSGEHNLWDNSNITESYGGITTPLTFSFAQQAYEAVYREFCRILGVPASVIKDNDTVFKRMLGLIRGRVYYNLLSWYRLLALLPGFTVNRRFMEQMMGVKEGLPDTVVKEISSSGTSKLLDTMRLLRGIAGLTVNHFLLQRKIRQFYLRLDDALAVKQPLETLNASQLTAQYHALERSLLTRWDAPLINDFFAMIFYGLLRKLTSNWCNDTDASLQNDLLAGEGGMISAEPAKRIRKMAELIIDDEKLIGLLVDGSVEQIHAAMAGHASLQSAYQAYLDKFGDRCLDELKLESPTLHDEPLILLRSIGHFAKRLHSEKQGNEKQGGVGDTNQSQSMDQTIRAKAEARVDDILAEQAIRRRVFHWVLKHARARVRDRENLRFERTRLFGQVRRLFVELGRRFYAENLLEDPRDLFYLEVSEVLGYVEGTTVTTDLKALTSLRQQEFANYQQQPAPADRFDTYGMVHVGNAFQASSQPSEQAEGELPEGELQGIGCCPGIVRGPVRVIRDPRQATLQAGDILVAERTDPGWIMLFPAAAGILVERGSLLSHSAIVAREMGIPAVVSVNGLMESLADGEWVEFDGSSGMIRRLETDQAPNQSPEQNQEPMNEQ